MNALKGLGRLLLRERHFVAAVEIWQKAVDLSPDVPSSVFQLARALHRNGQFDQAVAAYLGVLALAPTHEKALQALQELALRQIRAGNIDDAAGIGVELTTLAAASEGTQDGASSIAGMIIEAALPMISSAPRAALARFDAALRIVPESAAALRGAATCSEHLRRLEEARAASDRQSQPDLKSLERALQRECVSETAERENTLLRPRQPEVEPAAPNALAVDSAGGDRSVSLRDQSRPADVAAKDQQRGDEKTPAPLRRLAAKPAAADTLALRSRNAGRGLPLEDQLRRADVAARDGRHQNAEESYRRILAEDGANWRALSGLSGLYASQRRWTPAVEVLTRLNNLWPAQAEYKRRLAQVLMRAEKFEAARGAYAELSVLEPDDGDVWRALGQANARLGEWRGAREALSRVVSLRPDQLDARVELALACQEAGDVDAAVAELAAILERDADHRGALIRLGRLRFATDPDLALACWSRLAALEPQSVEPRLQIARLHHRNDRPEKAEAAFRLVLDIDATHGEALASLSQIVSRRDLEEASILLTRWSAADPTSPAPWLALGRLHADRKQVELSETAFRRALELVPSNTEAMTGLGRLYSANGKPDEAIEIWSELAGSLPNAVEPKLQIARISHARRQPGVEQALRSVLEVDPHHREALQRLAQVLTLNASTAEQALAIWDRLADLDYDAASSIVHRARLLERMGRIGEAEAEYRRAFARDPRHWRALSGIVDFFRRQQRWDEAMAICRQYLAVEPDRLDVLLVYGQILDRMNKPEEAQRVYDHALAVDPGNVTALGYRARLLREAGRIEEAIGILRRICQLDPRNADAWRELIFHLAGVEQEAAALATLDQAEQALGDTPQVWATLGRAAATALFEDRAIAYYERAIAAEPEHAGHHARLGLHYLQQGVLDGALQRLLDSRERDAGNVEVARGLFEVTSALRELGIDPLEMRSGLRTVGEILIPERLFESVSRVASAQVRPYEPVPRSVIAVSSSLAAGGAERQLANMLRGLSQGNFQLDLTLFCVSLAPRLRRDFFLPMLNDTAVKVVVPDAAAARDSLWHPEVMPFAGLIRHFPEDMIGSIAFWLQEFRQRRPQVVHAWQDSTNLTAVVAALLAGVPRIILCCRSVRPDNPRRRLRRFMREAYRAMLRHPSVVLSNNSRAGADDYAQWLGIASQRIEVVYNGVDYDRLANDPEATAQVRRELGIPDGAPVLGGVFRMSEEKRPLLWLQAAAEVARREGRAHFVVCGDGPMRDEMIAHAAALGIANRVHLPGAQSSIGAWYGMMDVVMLTSRHEGLPNVLLEAQSLGVPVVAPDVGGMSEVVEQGVTGWTVRNATAESLAERVAYCLSDQTWRKLASERGPVFIRQRFSVAAMLRRNLEVYGIPAEPAR